MITGRWLAIALLLIIGQFISSALGQEKPKIFLGASSKTLGYSPLWVASKKGFFDQQGLDVQLVLLRGVPMTLQALAAGSLQFGSGGPEPYIEASERGLDFVVTGGIINGIAQFLVAGKNYKSYEDLRGATFGTASLTGGTITALREALKLKGLEYPRDYKLLIIAGGSSANLAALQSGQIAASTVAVPLNFAAEESGLNVIGRLSEGIPHFQTNAFVVRRSWAEKNRPTMVRFMKAMVLALRWMHGNPDAAVEFLSKEMQLKPIHARKGWEFYTQTRFWPPDGDVTLEGLKNNIRFYADQTGAKGPPPDASKYVDRSYLLEALKELDKR
ncbi:MAG TPA: ABC transporter substrate-binding protein [Candidatus Limnocylindrales bacterium]|nr:ABC transporter substrate-binding protein [Candidatus Limnocylindrales bacterium]